MTAGSEPHPETGQPIGLPVDATPAQRPGPVTLKGRYGRVEKLKPEYAGDLWAAFAGHNRVWTYISGAGPFANESGFSAWLAERETLNDPYFYTVLDTADRAMGLLSFMAIRPEMRVIEVGNIAYGPALQRTPLGTETQYLLARYAFEMLGYRRYEWKCNSFNEPSRRAALRYGFTFEGILRQHMIAKGRSRDTAYFSMLDSEWPARKANFERWLAPVNFDGSGRQKVGLAELNGQKGSAS